MSNYERFGEDQESNGHTTVDLQAVGDRQSNLEDVHIKLDKEEDEGNLKIYSETKSGVEYIDDPSAKRQLTLYE